MYASQLHFAFINNGSKLHRFWGIISQRSKNGTRTPCIKVWRRFALCGLLHDNNTFGVLFLQPLPNVMLGNFPVNRTNSITQIVFQAITNVIKKKIATMVQMNKLAVSTFCHDLSFKFRYETFLWKSTIFLHMSNIKRNTECNFRVMGGNYMYFVRKS